ncbi:SDR family oxidoreductase [Paenibacillus sp. UMB4589-SE434]|uniref:SDR family oxidoreductase n=1 Tax=Paenibacillus sp. UMB4589-SE434 TaxID=3046314 RepID=UPI00254BD0E3|nr:SDR family oxidoreductase [Paenibacillus sp. UMB4589-SE434]MDK8184068.1 SDR family oxidoreductase [Paenibacillus sp. UMB4589-SE434]
MPSQLQPSHTMPPQHQNQQPGTESEMKPLPNYEGSTYKAAGKLKGKVALITGGDSGIGRAVAIAFAKEGASIAVVYLNEHEDALLTQNEIESEGVHCLLIPGDIGDESFCLEVIKQTITKLGGLNILVNNAAEQHPQANITDISTQQLEKTFKTNIFSMFHLTKAAMPHLKKGDTIINTTSVTAYRGSAELLDYSSTKGAVVSFTRSLSANLAKHGIRVNGVAPGPIWTPLIPSTFDEQKVSEFGANTPMQRPGQPIELAAGYVYLASEDSSYMSGQILHINGGEIVNG